MNRQTDKDMTMHQSTFAAVLRKSLKRPVPFARITNTLNIFNGKLPKHTAFANARTSDGTHDT